MFIQKVKSFSSISTNVINMTVRRTWLRIRKRQIKAWKSHGFLNGFPRKMKTEDLCACVWGSLALFPFNWSSPRIHWCTEKLLPKQSFLAQQTVADVNTLSKLRILRINHSQQRLTWSIWGNWIWTHPLTWKRISLDWTSLTQLVPNFNTSAQRCAPDARQNFWGIDVEGNMETGFVNNVLMSSFLAYRIATGNARHHSTCPQYIH